MLYDRIGRPGDRDARPAQRVQRGHGAAWTRPAHPTTCHLRLPGAQRGGQEHRDQAPARAGPPDRRVRHDLRARHRTRECANRPIKGFSGGERQRLGIAHAQINQPELLIPDEPAAALDPLGRRDVLEVMARLRGHTTIFYSTHILDDVQRVSDSVVIMDRGRLVRQAPIAELLAEVEGVMYQITLKGDTSAAQERIGDQPWVSHLRAETVGGQTTLEIAVSDETAAEARLLGLLVDQQCTSESFSLWPGSSDSSDRRSDTMAQFFIHFRAHRPNFIVDMTDAERTTMAEHSAYMKRLLDEGVLILTGPCLDGFGGVAIVEVEGEAAARRVIANDPAVQAGIGTSELHPFRVALMRTGASNDCHALAGR